MGIISNKVQMPASVGTATPKNSSLLSSAPKQFPDGPTWNVPNPMAPSSPSTSMANSTSATATPFLATPKPAAAQAPLVPVNPESQPVVPVGQQSAPITQPVVPPGQQSAPVTQPQSQGTPGLIKPPVTQYGSYVQQTAGAGTPSNTQTGIMSSLRDTAAGNAAIGQQAGDIAKKYSNEIDRVGKLGAGAVAGDLSTGTSVVGSGNAAIASQSASSRISALGTAEQAQLAGVDKQLTAQSQAGTQYGTALSGANTQQGNQITAYNSAANLSQPTTAAYGQTTFNPLTGQYEGNSGLPAETMDQYAKMAANGQYSAIPSSITSNPVLSAQLNAAAQHYNPQYSPITSAAQGAAQASNTQALGTAQTQGVAGVLQSLPAMQSANTAADGIKNTITNYLQQNPSLNATDLVAGNKIQQWVDGKQLADPKYQTLFNYLNEYTSTLAPVLGVGGNPTNLKTEIAQSFINAAASGKSIQEVLNNMSSLATNKITDLRNGASGGSTSVQGTGTQKIISQNQDGTLSAVSF